MLPCEDFPLTPNPSAPKRGRGEKVGRRRRDPSPSCYTPDPSRRTNATAPAFIRSSTMDQIPNSVDATSLSLLARVQANQPGSWERLVDLYAPLIYHWCRRSALSPEDAADVFQDVFRSVAEHIAGFRRDRAGATFRGWLRTITRNKIHDHFRRSAGPGAGGRRHRRPAATAGRAGSRRTRRTRKRRGCCTGRCARPLEALRGEFEPRTWQAFWKVQIEGQSTADVGAELDMTPAAVRKAKLRVLRRMREELGDLLEYLPARRASEGFRSILARASGWSSAVSIRGRAGVLTRSARDATGMNTMIVCECPNEHLLSDYLAGRLDGPTHEVDRRSSGRLRPVPIDGGRPGSRASIRPSPA